MTFQQQLDAFTRECDAAIEKAGPRVGPAWRMTAKNGGWALEEQRVSVRGTWCWYQAYWSRNKREIELDLIAKGGL